MLKVIAVMPLGEPRMPTLDAKPAMTADRLENRRSILQQLDLKFERVRAGKAIERLEKFQQRALSILTSGKTRDAFDLAKEPAGTRDRFLPQPDSG